VNSVDPRVVGLLEEARRKLERERQRRTGPVAIVGIGCRFPGGADDPARFWQLLEDGVDTTSEVPADRWDFQATYDPDPDAPGKSYVKRAAFLGSIAGFDAEFFGISPREAAGMDPQQRLLLEVAWEALEDAGIKIEKLRGSATGVWVGLCVDDYARRSLTSGDVTRIDAYSTLGNARSVAAGRISYVFDLRGPAVQIDTACSSSLVAVHQACTSLRAGECDLALVGGINLMTSPEMMIALSKLRALAKDGRCKPFDGAADGYGRGEGCGMVVLKRRADVQVGVDRVYALIRGVASNHDGHSNGLTAPNGIAQEALIRSALANAGVDARQVGYVEAHGTGTLLGDPIEVLALNRAYGRDRPRDQPLRLGAVKANIGHLEGAAGVAGLIKAALCLEQGRIPRTLISTQANPHIPWCNLAVQLAREPIEWPRRDQPRFAGVSSFGISGTNAHVVLEEAPRPAAAHRAPERSAELVILSARTPAALRALAHRILEYLESHPTLALGDVAYNLAARSALEQRLALAVPNRERLLERLRQTSADALPEAAVARGGERPKRVFVFPGRGSEWVGMGRLLMLEEPTFLAAMTACDRAIEAEAGWSVLSELQAGDEASRLHQVDVLEPLLFALQVALAASWRAWGVEPDLVVGHGGGEIAAACVSGALSVEQGAALVCRRSRLLRRISGRGAMAQVALPFERALAALAGFEDRLAVAANDGPRSSVLAGDPAALADVTATLEMSGVPCRRLPVDVASHSPSVDALLDELRVALVELRPVAAAVPFRSTLKESGTEVPLDASYWVDNLRQPVRFGRTIAGLIADGYTRFIEISPEPLLLTAVEQLSRDLNVATVVTGSLRRAEPGRLCLLESLGVLHVHGQDLQLERSYPEPGRRLTLPTYPWQRTRYWLEAPTEGSGRGGDRAPSRGAPGDCSYQLEWHVTEPLALEAVGTLRWAILSSDAVAADELVHQLRGGGADARAIRVEQLKDLRLADRMLWLVDKASGGEASSIIRGALEVAQTLARIEHGVPVCWVTRGAVAITADEDVRPQQAAIWGFGRTLQEEQPALALVLLDAGDGTALGEVLLKESSGRDGENQIAWRGTERRVARLVRSQTTTELDLSGNYQIENQHTGTLDRLALTSLAQAALEPAEIQIEVAAAGLNFRDVLTALGMYPGAAGPLGNECSGVVVAVGPEVEGFAVGDRVMALARGAFRRLVSVDARLAIHVPRGLSLEQAASIPVVFLTAWYALKELARLKPGERILVHAAAGGVGMAAVQLARAVGARVVGTAHPSKWDVVRALGVEQVASSRDLSFAEVFSGEAPHIDVLLNSLAGDRVDAGLGLLGSGGRFIELGKAALRHADELARSHPGVIYRPFDLGELGAEQIAPMLRDIAAAFDAGDLQPLPIRVFTFDQAEVAFRLMGRGLHVGKLILVPSRRRASEQASVLITGGLGALGLMAAQDLAARGVKHLVLMGRRGLETPGAPAAVNALEALGARVTVAAVDVTDRSALERVLATIPVEYPLRGVVHAAGVIDDGMLLEQTPERTDSVMAPKVLGAWHLHELTQSTELEFFVLFSSLAGTLGSVGQAAYSAANAFLDGLASHRRAHGRTASSLAWGPWSERGLAAKLDETSRLRLARRGILMISPEQGRALFDQAMVNGKSHSILARLDITSLAQARRGEIPSIWRALIPASAFGAGATRSLWQGELLALPPNERRRNAVDAVREEVARVLSSHPGTITAGDSLKDLGLDSLMAVELRNALERRAGARLPATLAFDHPTPEKLADYLLSVPLARPESSRQENAAPALPAAQRADEPIAIIGMGCRFPGGAVDPESYWHLLEAGVDAITEVPKERWDVEAWYDPDPNAAGKMTSRWGGFLRDLERFEPGFFGISPREAASIDPQERLLLETTWEAVERAGIPAEALMGSNTAVYVGLCGSEYNARLMADAQAIDAYAMLGTAHSTIVGRLSYWLGLEGPNLCVDTACSSSLVAVHLACQALRNGECGLAFAGAANVILAAETAVGLSRLKALSPTGRCHAFSADADGYVRAEGAGMLLLERLSDARKHGHPICALIRGSAINQDGRSNGMTAPNGPAQTAVIRDALQRAGVDPGQVGYVECHGTGTALGDPIEVQALAAALCTGRPPENPVVLGSVKSNLGHLEGAAGVAGLIKAVLVLQRGRIPRNLHFTAPNPHISWPELAVKVAAEDMDWPPGAPTRIAGVSSFGISGTNAHVVLEAGPPEDSGASAPARAAELVVLSAKTSASLQALTTRMLVHLEAHLEPSLGDLAFSLVSSRSLFVHRLTLTAADRLELMTLLGAAANGQTLPGMSRGSASPSRGKVAWLFTGQGSQVPGMGRELYTEWPAFRQALDAVCALLDPLLELPLREVMWASPGSSSAALLDQTAFTQPALFALEWALACLWRSWGVEPDIVLGHSIGEVTAAAVAGVFSLEDAARLVCARGRLMQALPKGGAMLSIAAPEAAVLEALQPFAASVSLAALNGPLSVVIAGVDRDVAAIADTFAARGVQTRQLSVSHAFHSPLIDPMLPDFREVAANLSYHKPRVPLVSTTEGGVAGPEIVSAEYWVRQARDAVRFAPAVETLAQLCVSTFIELGPRPVLLGLAKACLDIPGAAFVASLRPPGFEPRAALEALGAWVSGGGAVDWTGIFPAAGRRVPLPTYPWQRQRHWVERTSGTPGTPGARGTSTGHPLLGVRLATAGDDAVYELMLSTSTAEWVAQHRVNGKVVLPGTALAELVHAAATHRAGGAARELRSLTFRAPIIVDTTSALRLQVVLTEQSTRAAVFSQPVSANADEWTRHATADLVAPTAVAPALLDLEAIRRRCLERVDTAALYALFARSGVAHGPAFKGVRRLWRGDGEALAELDLPIDAEAGYGVHPALLDAALQVAASLKLDAGAALVPFEFGRFALHQVAATTGVAYARRLESAVNESLVAEVILADAAGVVLVEIAPLLAKRADPALFGRAPSSTLRDNFHRLDWQRSSLPVAAPVPTVSGRWQIVPLGEPAAAETLARELRALGATADAVRTEQLSELGPADHVVCLFDPSDNGSDTDSARAAIRTSIDLLPVVQNVARRSRAPRLWLITRRAVAVTSDEDMYLAQATVWGLGRTVLQEHPALRCTLLDVEPSAALGPILGQETKVEDESEIAWRGDRRHVARLIRIPVPGRVALSPADRAPLRSPGTALITGGLGALGLVAARHFAELGFKHLLLMSRRGLATPGAVETIAELDELGVQVTVAAADVSDQAALARVLELVPARHPLRAVVHAAGLIDDGLMIDQTPERFRTVMAPKVIGAYNLHELTAREDLDFFVLFSSIAGTLGSAAQSSYAAANAFLDALAAQRRARGKVALSIAWGPWSERGLAAQLRAPLRARLARQGIGMISPEWGRALLKAALEHPEGQLFVTPLDTRVLAHSFAGAVPARWRSLVRAAPAAGASARSRVEEIARLSPERRFEPMLAWVRVEVARVLSFGAEDVLPSDVALGDLGLDSLLAVELRTALGAAIGRSLHASLTPDKTVHGIAVDLLAGAFAEARHEPMGRAPPRGPAWPVDSGPSAAVCEALQRQELVRMRLFCFHDAGGSAAMFLPFVRMDVAGIEVHTISCARHAQGSAEGAAAAYLASALDYVRHHADLPYALFGHSLGALFAWRVCQELAESAAPQPIVFAPSASGPSFLAKFAGVDGLEAAMALLGDSAAAEDALAASKQAFLHDVALWAAMPAARLTPLSVPIAAFAGSRDRVATEGDARGWQNCTNGDFSLTLLHAAHSYAHDADALDVLLPELSGILLRELWPKPPKTGEHRRTQRWTTLF
jgi:acyl transferase domain-containing protein/surfactin synthase thioesterase subunit/acyl carrier protein